MSDHTCGTLYVVGTPIGNLGDFSPRAVETLQSVDFIAAEDTRVTKKLLTHFEIHKPLTSYYEHNKVQKGPEILGRILSGESCAIVTDAGMPAISDPGQDLVDQALNEDIPVVAIPGPTAFATALALSGLDSRRFTFEGFLNVEKRKRKEQLQFLATLPCTILLYEAPHKLSATLRDLLDALGDRQLVIVRELTKIHEEVIRTTLQAAVEDYPNNELKGELVLVLEGARPNVEEVSLEEAVARARAYVEAGMPKNNAAKMAARDTGRKKNEIYRELL